MKTLKTFIATLFCLIFLCPWLSGAAKAQESMPSIEKFNESIIGGKTAIQPFAPSLQTTFDNLISRAREKGTVKVIIGFRLENYQLDAELRNNEQETQRFNIKQKQKYLLNRLRNFEVINPKEFEFIPFISMEISADALTNLRNLPEITSIQEDIPVPPTLLESVPLIGAPAAWSAGFTGQGRTLAILDSGVDRFHPFFNGRVVSEGCYSTPSANSVSVCPGGTAQSTAVNSGLNCDVNQISGCSHGTHVAGIAAGGNPQINGAGVAKNAGIIAMQVFSVFFGQDCGSGPSPCILSQTSDQIRALERVYALRTTFNIDSVNMSLGGGQFFNYCDAENAVQKAAIDNLRSANIATVIASGNSSYTNSLGAPACISSAISVGSTHDGSVGFVDTVSSFSNSALFLSLLAPGEQILSSEPGGIYNNSQGTSQASPHVAGAWAVLKQRYPTDTVAQILTRLTYSGVPVLDTRNGIVKPRIRVDLALNTSNVNPCGTNAPVTLGQAVNGALTTADCLMSLGNRADIYTFNGTQGQGINIVENSTSFDTYLYLFDSNGALVAQDDDGNGGTNSRIPTAGGFLQLPSTGTYYVFATSFEGNRLGNYTMTATTNAPTCSYTISSGVQAFAATGGGGNFGVTTPGGCAWTAQSNAAWITVTAGSGNGNGTVSYTVAQNTSTAPRSGTVTAGGQTHTVNQAGASAPPNTRRLFDYDGDGRADISVFRPSTGAWYLLQSQNGFTGITFGQNGDQIAPADYDGDGKTDVAVFRSGVWYLQRSQLGFTGIGFGAVGDIPVPADYDGDGKADVAVFRPSTGVWYVQQSAAGFIGVAFGQSGDRPVAADYDGDGRTDVAVFRPSNGAWYLNRSQLGFTGVTFGQAGDLPVPADYDADGKADVAVFRGGTWYLNRSQLGFTGMAFGAATDRPVAADYDGDGRADVAVFRPSTGAWYLQQSTAGFTGAVFGGTGDLPTPAAYVP